MYPSALSPSHAEEPQPLFRHALLIQEMHLTLRFSCKFVISDLNKRNAVWRIIMEGPGYRCCKLQSLAWNAELPSSAAGSHSGGHSGLLLCLRLPTTGMGGWEAQLTSLLILLAKNCHHSARSKGERRGCLGSWLQLCLCFV